MKSPLGSCFLDHLLYLLYSRQNGAEGDKTRIRCGRNNSGEGGLTGARGAPKDHRWELIAFDGVPKGLSLAQEMILAHELRNRGGSHPIGEGGRNPPNLFPMRIE